MNLIIYRIKTVNSVSECVLAIRSHVWRANLNNSDYEYSHKSLFDSEPCGQFSSSKSSSLSPPVWIFHHHFREDTSMMYPNVNGYMLNIPFAEVRNRCSRQLIKHVRQFYSFRNILWTPQTAIFHTQIFSNISLWNLNCFSGIHSRYLPKKYSSS